MSERVLCQSLEALAMCVRSMFLALTCCMVCTMSTYLLSVGQGGARERERERESEAWGPPQFQEKRSRSQKAILGALGEFRGILGAALGIGNSILGIRNSILGMASHDLINTKPTILGATLGAIPGIAANPPERFSFAPAFSERFFKNWGGPRAPERESKSTAPVIIQDTRQTLWNHFMQIPSVLKAGKRVRNKGVDEEKDARKNSLIKLPASDGER